MRLLLVLASFLLFALPGMAQEAVPAATPEASIEDLIQILENDETRQQLIDRLRQDAETTPAEEPRDLSFARQLATYTQAAAEGASAALRSLTRVGWDLQRLWDGTFNADLSRLQGEVTGLVIVGIGMIGSYLLLRLGVHRIESAISARVARRRWWGKLLGILGRTAVEVAAVLLAWGLGYAIALGLTGDIRGQMGINQSLLLNAFLVVELSKLWIRIFLSPRHQALRVLPVGDSNAAYWQFWSARIISLMGYTFLFVAPLLAGTLSSAAAAAVQVLVMTASVVVGVVIVLQNRDDVRDWLGEIGERRQDGIGQLLRLLGQLWHALAIAYLLALLVLWFTNPDEALPFMLAATVQSIVAILFGMLVVTFISRVVSFGLNLSPDVKQRLPLLEGRLKAFVPRVMQIVRWVAILVVAAAIVQAWGVFDVAEWAMSDAGLAAIGSIISAGLILLVCVVLYVVVASWVEYRLNVTSGRMPSAREKTLLNLFKNAFTIALVVFGLMLALAQIGVNIAPLLAGAGVVGLAIGFGAQKLVQDIITGIFIQFENIMNEGDVVQVGDKAGTVEKLTIRSVTIRDMSGTVHLIPFSSVDQVSNMVRGFSFYVSEVEVAYNSDVEAVKQAMRDAFEIVMEHEDYRKVILDDLDLQGLIAITPTSMSFRSRIKTVAGQQWGAGRFYSETLLRLFAERGIDTPTQRIAYIPGRRSRVEPATDEADDGAPPALA
jgi:small-conductance mechanosensitive channel